MQFVHSLGSGAQEIAFLHRAFRGPLMSVQFSEIKGLNALFSPKTSSHLICFIKMTPLVQCPCKTNQEPSRHCPGPASRPSCHLGRDPDESQSGAGAAAQRRARTSPKRSTRAAQTPGAVASPRPTPFQTGVVLGEPAVSRGGGVAFISVLLSPSSRG